VFVVNVKPGISTTDAREKGFVEGAKAAGLDYVGREYSNDKPEVAAAKTKAALQKNPDLKGVFGTNLFSAEGAASGVREAGAKVKIVGFDAGPKQVKGPRGRHGPGADRAEARRHRRTGRRAGVQRARGASRPRRRIGTESTTITKDNLADSQDALYKPSC
jgi:ribose transport system substrate-binding protein